MNEVSKLKGSTTSMDINDQEFSRLMQMKKRFTKAPVLPKTNSKSIYQVIGDTPQEKFEVHIERKNVIEFQADKSKFQESYYKTALIRIEIDAPPHMNPDGNWTGRNHIHIYREGAGLLWAYDLSSVAPNLFLDQNHFLSLFCDFCQYCNIEIDTEGNAFPIQGVL